MSREYFWGCELNKDNPQFTWEPEELSSDYELNLSNTLVLKQGILGLNAINGELNIVEIKTEGCNDQVLNHPILRLRSGSLEQCPLDMFLPNTTVFRLVSGSGPVHLCGQQVLEVIDDENLEDEEEEQEEEENGEIVEATTPVISKKRRASNTPGKYKKGEEEEDDENESSVIKQKKQKGKTTIKESTKKSTKK